MCVECIVCVSVSVSLYVSVSGHPPTRSAAAYTARRKQAEAWVSESASKREDRRERELYWELSIT